MSLYRINIPAIPADAVPHLEKSIESVPHVESARVESDESRIVIEHDGAADHDEIITALRAQGIEPEL